MQGDDLILVDLAGDKFDDVGRKIDTMIAEQAFDALVVEVAFGDHQRRGLVTAIAVFTIINRAVVETGRGFPGERAFGATAALVVAELELLRLIGLINPDDKI